MAGGDDPVSDGLIAFVTAGPIPAIPFGCFVAGVADVANGYFGERPRRRLPMRPQKDRPAANRQTAMRMMCFLVK